MREIARQATVAWGRRGAHAVTTYDLFWIDIPPLHVEAPDPQVSTSVADAAGSTGGTMVWDPNLWDEPAEPDQEPPPELKRKWENDLPIRSRGPPQGDWKRGRGRGRGWGRGGGPARGTQHGRHFD